MSRLNGGYIGYDAEPATTAAPGIWTLREAELYQRKAQWPLGFEPDILTGLQLWLDASDTSTLYDATTGGSLVAADGGVARWEDKSGNARHATQGTAGARPLRKASVQNGLSVLRFDGSDDFLDPSNFSVSSSVQCFFVCKASGDSAGQGRNGPLFHFTTAQYQGHFGGTTDQWLETFFATSRVSLGSVSMNAFVQGRITTNATQMIGKMTGQPEVTTAATLSGSPTTKFAIGYGEGDIAPYYFNGDVGELIIYSPSLSETNQTLVESYLTAKWAIT